MAPLRSRAPRLAFAIVGIAAAMTLAGCKSTTAAAPAATSAPVASATPSIAPPVSTPPSSAPPSAAPPASATASATPSGSPTPSPSSTTATADVANALAQWKLGASAISAEQPKFWIKAADYLADAGASYSTEVKQLRQLSKLPDAQQSATQNKEYRADIKALNTFFKTPTLYQ
jgi:hypothetical protein